MSLRKICFVLLFVLIGIGIVSAGTSISGLSGGVSSSVVYQKPAGLNFPYSSEQMKTYWSILSDPESCKAREDFVLRIGPGACQPAVVRSDLLAEQNVPVFCQVSALLVNPLIDVEKIRNVRFSGSYPPEVAGVGFHPARVAIKSRDKQLGSPYIDNVGYVVIILKKQEIEKKLPDSINITLTAQVEYQSGNAFGIGKASFKLPLVSEDKKESERIKNSFWNGRLSPQLESVELDRATISLYQANQKLTSLRVDKGKPSSEFYLPGSYCMAGLKFYYDGVETSRTRALLQVVGGDGSIDSFEVYEGSTFLENNCKVVKFNPDETNKDTAWKGSVEVVCGVQK